MASPDDGHDSRVQEDESVFRVRQDESVFDRVIRLGGALALIGWCSYILSPFLGILLWAAVIAIGAEGPYERLVTAIGDRRYLAAALSVVIGLLVLIVPSVMLSETLLSGAQTFAQELREGTFAVPPPPENVAEWPVVGTRIYDAWKLASVNLDEAASQLRPQLVTISGWLLAAARSAGGALLEMMAAIFIAGFMLAHATSRHSTMEQLGERLGGPGGARYAQLASKTTQSVVQGIIGIAIIQAVLAGIALIAAGIPAAGLWAMLVLVSAVVQIPVIIALLPPILLAFSSLPLPWAIAFTVWCMAVALIDNVLKPMLFGRGVETPTLVIFAGAIGGMVTMGILGLFVGAVVLALGYEILNLWLWPDRAEEVGDAAA